VIARVLTLASGRATIRPDYASGLGGFHIMPDQYTCEEEWEKRGKDRHPHAVYHARIIALMAGAENCSIGTRPAMPATAETLSRWLQSSATC
jgi:hypothetical protein